ncbi:Eukaryotic translation initiation factor 3 subunit G [Galdieria sulphuraria]|nr:Eukaryotic translation initiation factor 3 subunit G [Galdieria sulphuraria]
MIKTQLDNSDLTPCWWWCAMATSSVLPTTKPVVREWADEDDFSNKLPPLEEWYDEEGLKHVVEYHFNEENKLVKTTKVFRVKKETKQVSKSVAERRHWKKFGDCQRAPPGPEPGVTAVSLDDVSIEYKRGEESEGEEDLKAKEQKDIQKMLAMQRFKRRLEERRAGVANWAQLMALKAGAQRDELEVPSTNANSANTGKYVPPHLRGGGRVSSDSSYTRDDSATVRVSNLSPNTTESDLQELFHPFGKGFAFVSFSNREDARKCIEKLDGYGYDHLILRCEWAKPSENKRGQK